MYQYDKSVLLNCILVRHYLSHERVVYHLKNKTFRIYYSISQPTFSSFPLKLQSDFLSRHCPSHPQYKFTIRIPRIQHPMRLMDIRKIVNMRRFSNPVSILDMPYNILQWYI